MYRSKTFKTVLLAMSLFLVFSMGSAWATAGPTLSYEINNASGAPATQFMREAVVSLNIAVNDATQIAGCAFTVGYNNTLLDPPAVDAEGVPVDGSITSAFPFTYETTDTFRANDDETTGKVYLSGAAIGANGGPVYTVATSTVLFTLKFKVKADAPFDSTFDFDLLQTELFNLAAGYGADNDSSGDFTAGDTKDPVPVLVGAVAQGEAGFDNFDCSTGACAFPVVLGGATTPFATVTSAVSTVIEAPEWTIAGTVNYTGAQTGTLKVAAFASTDTTYTTPIGDTYTDYPWNAGATSQAFTLSVPDGSYILAAYIDNSNVNVTESSEASGAYTTPIEILGANDTTNRDFTLTEPDSNGDGLPNYWVEIYTTAGVAGADTDRDGYSNLVEYQNGYDPENTQEPAGGPGYDPATDERNTTWEVTINALGEDLGGVFQYDVTFGLGAAAATLDAPPAPPTYSVKTELYPDDWSVAYSKDVRQSGEAAYRWILAVNPHGNVGAPTARSATLSWDPASFAPYGSYRLRSGFDGTGAVVVSDMRTTTEYTVTGTNTDQFFNIEFSFSVSVDLSLTAGWNLISLPVTPDDANLSALFPNATVAYKFEGAYQQATTLEPGLGYWIKVPEGGTYTIQGQSFDAYTVSLDPGWHLMGAVGATGTPATSPAGEISVMYGFSGSYSQATEFEAGKGYWVKVLSSCDFSVPAP